MTTREQKGLTREKASELIDGITPGRLEKLENYRTAMQPEDVMLIARAYKEPGLCNYYCTHECAIGRIDRPEIEEKDLPQIAVELVNGIGRLNEKKDKLLQIAEDGTVGEEEYREFASIKELIDKLVVSGETLKLWLKKAEAEGKVDPDSLG